MGTRAEVSFHDDPARVLAEAKEFLASEPVLHNLILTLLHARIVHPEPGRYWVSKKGSAVTGVVFQSPLCFPANLTPMEPEVIAGVVRAIVESGAALPGAQGDATTAARFAGQWTERTVSAAVPTQGLRVYQLLALEDRAERSGSLRRASSADRDLVIGWMRGFQSDIGEPWDDPEAVVDERILAGRIWLWDDGGPVSMACSSEPVEGVVRVQIAYTPPDRRNRGYAGACVGGLSREILGSGHRPILYTDLGNPVSNFVFRRIGYRAVAEVLRYRFE